VNGQACIVWADVHLTPASLQARFDVEQYGALSIDPARYPLFVVKSRPGLLNLKFTGLTQNLGLCDYKALLKVLLRILGQPCEFYLLDG
jgi:hypothetical protein